MGMFGIRFKKSFWAILKPFYLNQNLLEHCSCLDQMS